MRALMIVDDPWHPAEVIERGVADIALGDIQLDWVRDAKDILTPEMLRDYRVVIVAKGNAINAANPAPWFDAGVTECDPAALAAYVREGGGLLAVHAALSVGRTVEPAYTDLLGAYFMSHPSREEVRVSVSARHAITEGVSDFVERDEHYQIAITAPDAEIFLTSRSEHGGCFPSGFARAYGKGRIADLTPGHTLGVWRQPSFQRLFVNAVRWCAGE